jgi:hypothetical protein
MVPGAIRGGFSPLPGLLLNLSEVGHPRRQDHLGPNRASLGMIDLLRMVAHATHL